MPVKGKFCFFPFKSVVSCQRLIFSIWKEMTAKDGKIQQLEKDVEVVKNEVKSSQEIQVNQLIVNKRRIRLFLIVEKKSRW